MPVRMLIGANRDKRGLFDAVDLPFDLHFSSEEGLLHGLVEREWRYFCPASNFSVPLLDQRLAEASPQASATGLRAEPFAAVPIVLLMSPEVYAALAEAGPVGWASLLEPSAPLSLMHAHDNSADGLAVLAAINQAATLPFGPVPVEQEHAGRDEIVHSVERLVRQYAPDDLAVLDHGLADGRWRADVLALRQDTAYAAMRRHPGLRAVLVHPVEGSAWAHLVLGASAEGDSEDPAAFSALVAELRSPRLNQVYLANGVVPVATSGPPATVPGLTVIGSPGAAPGSPPARRLVRTLRRRAQTLKRSADIVLVLDVSSSMRGEPLIAAKRGLLAFLDRLTGSEVNVGLVVFESSVRVPVEMQPLASGGSAIRRALDSVYASGMTALLDGVDQALDMLRNRGGRNNLKVAVVLTDGEENRSRRNAGDVERRLLDTGYLFFGIAYGGAAGRGLLNSLAESGGGHSLVTDESGIAAAYETLAQHV